ncbi:MAG: hypothetical protein ACU836_05150 [Gammaproteobacteria bacterium]
MKLLTRRPLALALLAGSLSFQPAYAVTTPAGQNKLRIQTSLPKKAGESLFSYTVEWRQDGGKLYHSTGMSFLDANKLNEPGSTERVAKKLASSIKESMIRLDPIWRGLMVDHPQEQADFTLSNKAGYALTSVVVRDYTNQALRFDLVGKNFSAEAVQLAFDLVLAADVEYLDKFSGQKSQIASGGDIEIALGEQNPIHIKTDGKTTRELETEIARQLTLSKLSDTTLVASQIHKDTRNIKPFDGSEVQLLNLAEKSIAIDIKDPSLGVLLKFKFKDDTHAAATESRSMLVILVLTGLMIGGYFWRRKMQVNR